MLTHVHTHTHTHTTSYFFCLSEGPWPTQITGENVCNIWYKMPSAQNTPCRQALPTVHGCRGRAWRAPRPSWAEPGWRLASSGLAGGRACSLARGTLAQTQLTTCHKACLTDASEGSALLGTLGLHLCWGAFWISGPVACTGHVLLSHTQICVGPSSAQAQT